MSRALHLTDVGPIKRLEIPLPEGGGVVVLRGRNGIGKSHALEAVRALELGKGTVPTRDGALGALVEGLGARLTVARKSSRSGAIECRVLEGADPSRLVEPGLKDPGAADAERLRQLCLLAGAQADVGAFAELLDPLGGKVELERIARPASLAQGDIVAMAAAIKRDLEAAARLAEGQAETLSTASRGLEQAIGDVPDLTEAQIEAAREEMVEAAKAEAATASAKKAARQAHEAAHEAQAALEDLGDRGTEEALAASQVALEDARMAEETISRQLRDAQEAARVAATNYAGAQRDAAYRTRLTRAIEAAAQIPAASEQDLLAASQRLALARERAGKAESAQRARTVRAEVRAKKERAGEASERAGHLRAAAAGCAGVVQRALSTVCPADLRVQDGRLLYQHAERGEIAFSELSQGERWRVALDIAIAALGEGGLLVVDQEGWEGLDPVNREAIAEHLQRTGTVMLTAEADAGDLRAEP